MDFDKMTDNKIIYKVLPIIYFIFLFVLYFLVSEKGTVEISIDKMFEPFYSEEHQAFAYVFTFLSLANIFMVYRYMEIARNNPALNLVALTIPEIPALLGFVLGFLTLNFSVAIPFTLLGLLIYLFVYKGLGL